MTRLAPQPQGSVAPAGKEPPTGQFRRQQIQYVDFELDARVTNANGGLTAPVAKVPSMIFS